MDTPTILMTDSPPCALVYDLHGVRIATWGDPALAAALAERFGQFPRVDPDSADVTFTFCSVPDAARHVVELPPRAARTVYASEMGDVLYDEATNRMHIVAAADRVRVRCDHALGRVWVSIVRAEAADLWLLSHPLVTLPLIELLKRHGLYSLHAAGAAVDGAGLVFPGASGSGKSTLALALARAGWDVLGDDFVFLAPGTDTSTDGLSLRAFPEAIDVTDDTIGLFPELPDLQAAPRPAGFPKRRFHLPDRYGSRIAWTCRPATLIFPHVAGTRHSTLTPLDRDEALLELAPNVLLTDSSGSQAHLDALAELVGASACYRLDTGTDLDALPALLRDVVEAHR